jgi:hypothetical protein
LRRCGRPTDDRLGTIIFIDRFPADRYRPITWIGGCTRVLISPAVLKVQVISTGVRNTT